MQKKLSGLDQDEYSKIIEIDDEYYIYRVGETLALDDSKLDALRSYLLKEKEASVFDQWVLDQKAALQVTVNPSLEHFYSKDFELNDLSLEPFNVVSSDITYYPDSIP